MPVVSHKNVLPKKELSPIAEANILFRELYRHNNPEAETTSSMLVITTRGAWLHGEHPLYNRIQENHAKALHLGLVTPSSMYLHTIPLVGSLGGTKEMSGVIEHRESAIRKLSHIQGASKSSDCFVLTHHGDFGGQREQQHIEDNYRRLQTGTLPPPVPYEPSAKERELVARLEAHRAAHPEAFIVEPATTSEQEAQIDESSVMPVTLPLATMLPDATSVLKKMSVSKDSSLTPAWHKQVNNIHNSLFVESLKDQPDNAAIIKALSVLQRYNCPTDWHSFAKSSEQDLQTGLNTLVGISPLVTVSPSKKAVLAPVVKGLLSHLAKVDDESVVNKRIAQFLAENPTYAQSSPSAMDASSSAASSTASSLTSSSSSSSSSFSSSSSGSPGLFSPAPGVGKLGAADTFVSAVSGKLKVPNIQAPEGPGEDDGSAATMHHTL